MKNTLTIVVLIASAIGIFFIGRSTKKVPELPDNSGRITEISQKMDQQQDTISSLKEENEELKQIIQANEDRRNSIDVKENVERIDSSIAADSANALKEYRASLKALGTDPDAGEHPTFRELGAGAKYMSEIPGLHLKIKYDDMLLEDFHRQVNNLDEQVERIEDQLKSQKDITQLTELDRDRFKQQYEATQSFWYHRFIAYAGTGLSYNEQGFRPAIHIGFGIRIWGNE